MSAPPHRDPSGAPAHGGELLERWLLADHPWRPSIWQGYRSNARQLANDAELAGLRVVSLTPRHLRATSAAMLVALMSADHPASRSV